MANILGTDGDDRGLSALRGTNVDDVIDGLEGRDEFIPLFGTDSVNGGSGLDTLIIDYSSVDANVFYQVSTVTSPGGSSTFYSVRGGSNSVTYAGIEAFDVIGSATQNNSLQGAAFADRLIGGGGADTIKSFAGDDIVDVGQGRATGAATAVDVVELGAGDDDLLIADYSAATDAVSFRFVSSSSGAKDYFSSGAMGADYAGVGKLAYSGVERFSVQTGAAADRVTTGDNNDTLGGGAGADSLNSGRGRATIDGGKGDDVWIGDLSVRADGAVISTNIKLDLNFGSKQTLSEASAVVGVESVRLTTGAGADVVTTHASGRYQDTVTTGEGDDTVVVSGAATGKATSSVSIDDGRFDAANLGAGGDDLLIANYAKATEAVSFRFVSSSSGAKDYFSSGAMGADYAGLGKLAYSGVERFSVQTGEAADRVTTGDNNDTLGGGAGADSLNSGRGRATIDGGKGDDTWTADLSIHANGAIVKSEIVLNLNDKSKQTLSDDSTVDGVESVRLTTGAGSDIVTTHASGRYQDSVTTGGGNDTVIITGAARGDITAGVSIDTVEHDVANLGAGGNDLLVADYAKAVEAVSFRFVSSSSGAKDYFSSGALGADYAGVGKLAYSGVERFTVTTGSADDSITTGDNSDKLSGRAGQDVLRAGGGQDTLAGGRGDDSLDGGAGTDRFVVGGPKAADLTFGVDTILSFDDRIGETKAYDGLDRIDLTSFRSANGDDPLSFRDDLLIKQVGTDTVIRLDLNNDSIADTRDKIVLRGVEEVDVGARDFLF